MLKYLSHVDVTVDRRGRIRRRDFLRASAPSAWPLVG